ncbi:MAG: MFS transporter [Chloroflexi bacterium]|nr:MFS transporter [Chloroflexota bacterium]MBU1749903.1 MFS transporter [Chloroflexota bacterium]MBU1877918.1 MFS transporter [Chloroflexota bacterium]
MSEQRVSYLTVLRNRNFAILWGGQIVSQIGDAFNWLAMLITVERLTGSTMAMGFMAISLALPQLLFGMLAGVFVDRFDRRRTMIASDVLRGLVVLLCLLVHSPEQVPLFYVVGFTLSTFSIFFLPAKNAVIPLIVAEQDLLAANALSQSTQVAALIVGSTLAGIVVGQLGMAPAFIIDSATFFVSAGAIWLIAVPRTVRAEAVSSNAASAAIRDVMDGLRFIGGSRIVLGMTLVMSIVHLGLGAINTLWVPLMSRHLNMGPEAIGAVDAAQGIGMIAGAAILGLLAARLRKIWLVNLSLVLIGLCIAAMGLIPAVPGQATPLVVGTVGFWLVWISTLVLGVGVTPAVSTLNTIIQLVVPDAMMGRVNSTIGTLGSVAMLTSMAGAAILGDLIGIPTVYVVCGLVVVGAGVVGMVALEEPAPYPRPAPVIDEECVA